MSDLPKPLWEQALGPTPRLESTEELPKVQIPECELVVQEGPDQGKRFLLEGARVQVGKSEENDVVLIDSLVSRVHFAIEDHPDGYLIKDLGSTNGTTINGVRTKEAVLPAGSTIVVGATTIRFQPRRRTLVVTPNEGPEFAGLVGHSLRMREIFGYIKRVATTQLSVVILGESGTGKEVFARAIHLASERSSGPIVTFDCGSVESSLVGSALFGHKVGAFTGATNARKGAFASAHGGTLFLDEIGELPLDLQPLLLRALETREIQPVGADQPQKVNVRVLCATHRNLKEMVAIGRFRLDLFYRLSGLVLSIPPLRERPEDILPLADSFLKAARPGLTISNAAVAQLTAYSWPGNVRELRNVIHRAAALTEGESVDPADLIFDEPLGGPTTPRPPASHPPTATSAAHSLEDVEKEAIENALRVAGWHKGAACKILGVTYKTLREKIRRYGLKPK